MSDEIAEFLQADRARRSKLAPLAPQIALLLKAGASYGQISSFLKQKNVRASRGEIHGYVARHPSIFGLTADKPATAPAQHNELIERVKTSDVADQAGKEPASPPRPSSNASLGASIPEFDWEEIRQRPIKKW